MFAERLELPGEQSQACAGCRRQEPARRVCEEGRGPGSLGKLFPSPVEGAGRWPWSPLFGLQCQEHQGLSSSQERTH